MFRGPMVEEHPHTRIAQQFEHLCDVQIRRIASQNS